MSNATITWAAQSNSCNNSTSFLIDWFKKLTTLWQAGQPVAFHHGAGNSSQVRNYNYSDISNNNKSNLLKSHYIKVWYFQRIYSDGELTWDLQRCLEQSWRCWRESSWGRRGRQSAWRRRCLSSRRRKTSIGGLGASCPEEGGELD